MARYKINRLIVAHSKVKRLNFGKLLFAEGTLLRRSIDLWSASGAHHVTAGIQASVAYF